MHLKSTRTAAYKSYSVANFYCVTKQYETEQNYLCGTEIENRNEINIFEKQNLTKQKKIKFSTPGFDNN
jgi:hypothetical protein